MSVSTWSIAVLAAAKLCKTMQSRRELQVPSPREIRLDRLRPAPLEVPAGVIILPAMVPRRLWPLSVLIERVSAEGSYADLTPCPSCDYPREATACASCAVGHRSPESRTTALRPPSGVFKLPFDWIESRFLHQ